VRPSKKPRLTSEYMEADVWGECLTSSVNANVPQFVTTLTV